MEKEEFINNLARNIFLLARLGNSIQDKFFATKLEEKICSATASLINLLGNEERTGDVAQYQVTLEKSISSIDNILELLKELVYLNLLKTGPLFFTVEQNLLRTKLEVIRRRKVSITVASEAKVEKVSLEKTEPKKAVQGPKKSADIKLAGSKKQILDFIKLYPEIRTKDIIYEFNALSGRTIKRNLTDLLRSGFVKKRIDNKAVYYSVSN